MKSTLLGSALLAIGLSMAGCIADEDESLDFGDLAEESKEITGGALVTGTGVPWNSVVKISGNGTFCTATRVSTTKFLTAGHCIVGLDLHAGGEVNITNSLNGLGSNSYTVVAARVHPAYTSAGSSIHAPDVGLVEIAATDIPVSQIPVLALAYDPGPGEGKFATDGMNGMIVAYGYDYKEGSNNSTKKQLAGFPAISLSQFLANQGPSYGNEWARGEYTVHILARPGNGIVNEGGDSGAPWLFFNSATSRYEIFGVHSHDTFYVEHSASTRISNVYDWVMNPISNSYGHGMFGSFVNAKTDKTIAVFYDGLPNSGAAAVQRFYDGRRSAGGRWFLEEKGGGWFNIKNQSSASLKCLGVASSSTASGAAVNQYSCTTAYSMQWKFVPVTGAPGTYRIQNRNSNLCIGPDGGSAAENKFFKQYTCSSTDETQRWIFTR